LAIAEFVKSLIERRLKGLADGAILTRRKIVQEE
jgi:hypothetical protein